MFNPHAWTAAGSCQVGSPCTRGLTCVTCFPKHSLHVQSEQIVLDGNSFQGVLGCYLFTCEQKGSDSDKVLLVYSRNRLTPRAIAPHWKGAIRIKGLKKKKKKVFPKLLLYL